MAERRQEPAQEIVVREVHDDTATEQIRAGVAVPAKSAATPIGLPSEGVVPAAPIEATDPARSRVSLHRARWRMSGGSVPSNNRCRSSASDGSAGSTKTGWWDVPVPAYLPERRAEYEREHAEEQL